MSECKRDFAADRKLCEAATPGPWKIDGDVPTVVCGKDVMFSADDKDDAKFIAAAREGWPAALDRIAELEAQNAVLRQVLWFYANREIYTHTSELPAEIFEDCGERARKIVQETPSDAAKRVGALVDALRVAKPYLDMAANYDRFVEFGVSWKDPVATQVRDKMADALAKWEGK